MPIFAYLIVQGFFYTKDLKRYIFRVFVLATVTQTCLMILGYINQVYYPNYWIGVNNYLGVVYSYTLSLVLLAIIDRKIIIKKLNEKQNLLLRINIFVLIALAYLNLKIEFDMRVPFIILELYGIEKLFEKNGKTLLKQGENVTVTKRLIYLALILVSFAISICFVTYSSGCKYAMLASIIFIALYTGEKGKRNSFVKYLFYLAFPLQHVVLYLIAMI